MTQSTAIQAHLDLLDAQRERALAALAGLSDAQIWQRPAPKEWSMGEILNHNYLLIASAMPLVRGAWRFLGWFGRWRRQRPYKTDIPDLYRTGKFPMWTGFIWTPRHNALKPVPLTQLAIDLQDLHARVREFYAGKEEDVLGNIYLYDPLFGFLNLITTLRLGIYHDQLHYDDVIKQAQAMTGI